MAVPVTIGGRMFFCERLSDADFADRAAVYVVLCVAQDGSWTVLDVGQSGQVGSRIDNHDRESCWKKHCPYGDIWVCVYSMPSSRYTREDREEFEAELRSKLNPPCGTR